MLENPRGGKQARNFTTNVSKILDPKSSSEQIFYRKLSLGAPEKLQKEKRLKYAALANLSPRVFGKNTHLNIFS